MLNLEKGARMDLTKGSSVSRYYFGLGWDLPSVTGGNSYDLDVSAFLLDANGVCSGGDRVVYYGTPGLASADGSVKHGGDNLTGAGDGDDESIVVDLSLISADVTEIAIFVTIHMAQQRNQNFGGVRNAFIRVAENDKNGTETARFDLEEDYSAFTAIHFASLYKKDGDWKFKTVGDGFKNDLNQILAEYQTPATA